VCRPSIDTAPAAQFPRLVIKKFYPDWPTRLRRTPLSGRSLQKRVKRKVYSSASIDGQWFLFFLTLMAEAATDAPSGN
jgi:hypothetical protein